MSDLKARLLAGTQEPLFDLRLEAYQEIEALEYERDSWRADANLMLGFADLAYEAGAQPSSSELIAAMDRAVTAIRNAALEEAARAVNGALVGNPRYDDARGIAIVVIRALAEKE